MLWNAKAVEAHRFSDPIRYGPNTPVTGNGGQGLPCGTRKGIGELDRVVPARDGSKGQRRVRALPNHADDSHGNNRASRARKIFRGIRRRIDKARSGPHERCRAVDGKIGVIEDIDIRIIQSSRTLNQEVGWDDVVRSYAARLCREPGRCQEQFGVFSVARGIAWESENVRAVRAAAPNPLAHEKSFATARAT